MDIFSSPFNEGSPVLLWINRSGRQHSAELTLALDDYDACGGVQVQRCISIVFWLSRKSWKTAWSVARRILHSHPARLAVIDPAEHEVIHITQGSPRLAWMTPETITGAPIRPRCCR